MFGLSRIVSFIIVFFMGFGLATFIFFGLPAAMIANYSLRDLENTGLIDIPDDKYLNPPPESEGGKDVLDLNGWELYEEIQYLQDVQNLNMQYLKTRYGIIFDEKLQKILPDFGEAMMMPLPQFFSMEGVHAVLRNVYIGNIEGYQCMNADGTPNGDPKVEGSYWVHNGKKITALEAVIANFTMDDFVSGNINTDNLFYGDESIIIADILGYTQNEQGHWYDRDDQRVTGIMAVFAPCNLGNIGDEINNALVGELLGYVQVETGEYDEEGNPLYYWEQANSETGEIEKVSGLMAVVADRKIGNLGEIYDVLTVGDIIGEESRNGIFAIIPPETKFDEISTAVNDSIMGSPLQFFMNEKLITFDGQSGILDNMATYSNPATPQPDPFADKMGYLFWETYNDKNLYTYYQVGSAEYEKNKQYFEFDTVDDDGNPITEIVWEYVTFEGEEYCRVPTWRTKPLNASFGYIISLVSCTAPATPLPGESAVVGE